MDTVEVDSVRVVAFRAGNGSCSQSRDPLEWFEKVDFQNVRTFQFCLSMSVKGLPSGFTSIPIFRSWSETL